MVMFQNRHEAGRQLGERLATLELEQPIVLAIPRGGIPVAVEAGKALEGAPVGVVVARKLGAPGHEELAIGAVTSNGSYYLDSLLARTVGASERYIEYVLHEQQAEAKRREVRFNGHRTPPVSGRNVIVVDDGIATGATAIAAIRAIKSAGAKFVCFAVPVGPADTVRALRSEADEVIALSEPADFWAVGMYYRDFRQVDDEECVRLLDSASAAAHPTPDRG
jgi:putative phosphoribosyl transferase